jgi:signal transduction histidine kinase
LVAEVNVARLSDRIDDGGNLRLDALDAQADAMDVRLLILDRNGTVRYDTSETEPLRGESLPQFVAPAASVLAGAQTDQQLHYEIIEPTSGELFAGQRVLVGAGQTGPLAARRALVIVTDERRFPLLGRFLPRLFLITGVSLTIASLAGLLLSRHIARPIERLTNAADQMSAGQLDQHVPEEGADEIGQLVGSFNAMSRRVAATYQSQRDLLANFAHELRTPLTSMQGYTRALQDGTIVSDAERSAALHVIERESERMKTLIAQLLDLARLESGQIHLMMKPVPARQVVDPVVARFEPAAMTKGVALLTSSPPDVSVRGDSDRLIQILSNLVDNAVRHTPTGGEVSISTDSISDEHGNRIATRITVRDTGDGTASDRLGSIFERFARVESNSPDSSGKTRSGLGLAITRELVELHGGQISVASQVGQGTTFTMIFPF